MIFLNGVNLEILQYNTVNDKQNETTQGFIFWLLQTVLENLAHYFYLYRCRSHIIDTPIAPEHISHNIYQIHIWLTFIHF